jgi:threonine 3-dehydrogenase
MLPVHYDFLQNIFRRIFATWQACESLLASGEIDVRPIVSHEYPMSQYKEAFDTLFSGDACKILLDPQS